MQGTSFSAVAVGKVGQQKSNGRIQFNGLGEEASVMEADETAT
jgi:hypothetical protein